MQIKGGGGWVPELEGCLHLGSDLDMYSMHLGMPPPGYRACSILGFIFYKFQTSLNLAESLFGMFEAKLHVAEALNRTCLKGILGDKLV